MSQTSNQELNPAEPGSGGNAPPANGRLAGLLPLLVLAGWGVFILVFGLKAQCTNIDEVYFADPVINYLTGRGYTSAVWGITDQSQPHVSTAPAYSGLLLVWLKAFGIEQAAVRLLPALLALGAAALLWLAARRAGWIRSGLAGALLISVVLLDYGLAFSYSVGRPDALSLLLMAVLLYVHTLKNRRLSLAVMAGLALLMPFVQWGCVIFLGLLSLALLLLYRRRYLPEIAIVGLGLVAGLLLQKAAYQHWGVWEIWMSTIKSEGSVSLLERVSHRLDFAALLKRNSNIVPKDLTALILLLGMIGLGLHGLWRRRHEQVRLAVTAGVLVATIFLGMYFLGKFPTYYGWMLCVPLALLLASCFDRIKVDAAARKWITVIVMLAAAAGLPLQVALAVSDWHERQPEAVTRWLAPQIAPTDVVYCDYPLYFIAKQRTPNVYVGKYCHRITAQEYRRLTMVIVSTYGSEWGWPERLQDKPVIGRWHPARAGILGNQWQYGILSAPNYSCTVYRY